MLDQLLSRNRDEIVVRCQRKLRERHPDRPVDELLDTIPGFLDELIKAERRLHGLPETTTLPVDSMHAREHGQQRFDHGYAIGELPQDFGTISDVIGELAIEQGVTLDPVSYKLLNECLDRAISQSITEYFTLARASEDHGVAEWIGSLGHELRNALSSAMMAWTAISAGHVGNQSRTAQILQRSLSRMESLIARTLAAMQLKSGAPIQAELINLRALVEDTVDMVVRDRSARVNIDIDSQLTLIGDARLLESALSNLIQNAVKYSRPGGTIDVRARWDAGGTTIEVEDECGGFGTHEDPDTLFEAFEQGERTDGNRGVGLGLAITRQAVEAHAGKITVRDLAPKGCVFTIWLPREDPARVSPPP